MPFSSSDLEIAIKIKITHLFTWFSQTTIFQGEFPFIYWCLNHFSKRTLICFSKYSSSFEQPEKVGWFADPTETTSFHSPAPHLHTKKKPTKTQQTSTQKSHPTWTQVPIRPRPSSTVILRLKISRTKLIATFDFSKTRLLHSSQLQSWSKYFLKLLYKMPEAPMKIGCLEGYGGEESTLKLWVLR